MSLALINPSIFYFCFTGQRKPVITADIFFIDVILPIPLTRKFTYSITEAEAGFLTPGMRVAVPFGKAKIYTALVYRVHQNPPVGYEAKEIHQILDENPIVLSKQLKHWDWLASYYMCTLGEVFRTAMPSGLLLESETEISLNSHFEDESKLTNEEFVIFEALQHRSSMSIDLLSELVPVKNSISFVKDLLQKEVIVVKEQLYDSYKPKLVKYVRLAEAYSDESELSELLDALNRAKKQRELVLTYFQMAATTANITAKELLEVNRTSPGVLTSLIEKGIFVYDLQQVDRVSFAGTAEKVKVLTEEQQVAFLTVKKLFNSKQTVLLKGVTSSGKTEIYMQLIKEMLDQGRQVLYLLPEIALTTQIIQRLQAYFGNVMSVYHSRYSMNERIEVWNNLVENSPNAQLILGARSALLLPYTDLGLIIVDEEHEPSYKQHDPAPRYHARDAAVILAQYHKAKVLMGSATPELVTYHNARDGKYGLVELKNRYGNVLLPDIELVDLKEKYRKKRMTGHFSDRLLKAINEAVTANEQVILFQNRRGYAPVIECHTCGHSPQCQYCDVSLTYHKFSDDLRCHYCGYRQGIPKNCQACGGPDLSSKGLGTEQIELELKELFPDVKIGRMDLDTTRGKQGYEKIIQNFQSGAIQILVGTQMLSKGLDFKNVTLVGIMNADTLLNFPDFRAHERSFQLMVQVSGRAGRMQKRGKVLIQSFNPYHQILQQVSVNDYEGMCKEQLDERWQYHYPPFYRMIRITLKHKLSAKVTDASLWLYQAFKPVFKNRVLGPSTPPVSRIRNAYIRQLLIKIPPKQSLSKTKEIVHRSVSTLHAIQEYRAVRVVLDVDPI